MSGKMSGLLKMPEEELNKLIYNFLTKRMGSIEDVEAWYFVVNAETVLIKVYANGVLIFTIKAKLSGDHLEPVEVS